MSQNHDPSGAEPNRGEAGGQPQGQPPNNQQPPQGPPAGQPQQHPSPGQHQQPPPQGQPQGPYAQGQNPQGQPGGAPQGQPQGPYSQGPPPGPQPQGQYPQGQYGQGVPQGQYQPGFAQGQQPGAAGGPYAQGPGAGHYQQGPAPHGYSQQGAPFQQAQPAQPKKSKVGLIIGAVVVVVLVAVGAFLIPSLLRGATPAAAEGVPADALGVVEINLKPAVKDQLAVKEFADKFPLLRDDMSSAGDDYKRALWELVDVDDEFDYEADIEPWLGDSVAVAMLGDPQDPEPLLSIEVTDEKAAEELMSQDDNDVDYVIDDGLLLIFPETNTTYTRSLDEILETESITSQEGYKDTTAKLEGEWLVTMWGGSELIEAADSGMYPELGIDVDDAAEIDSFVAGMRIADGSVVVKGIATGSPEMDSGGLESDFADSMPADAVVSIATGVSEESLDLLWDMLVDIDEGSGALAQLGLNSKADLATLIGDQFAVSLLVKSGEPAVGLKVQTDDPAGHQAFMDNLMEMLMAPAPESEVEGDTVYTTFGMPISDLTDAANPLAESDSFKKLTSDSTDPETLAWVNFDQIIVLLDEIGELYEPEIRENLEPIDGVGLTASIIGDGETEILLQLSTK